MFNRLTGKQWVGTLAALLLVPPIAQQCGRHVGEGLSNSGQSEDASQHFSAGEAVPQTGNDDVIAMASRQPALELTEDKFDTAFVEQMGNWMADSAYQKVKERQKVEGGLLPPVFVPEAVLVEAGGRKFGIIRARSGTNLVAVSVVGLVGSELVRVSCIPDAGRDVLLTVGACGAKIKEAFGVSIIG